MNVLLLIPTKKSCVALRGGVTTQMGVTGAHVKMDTPIIERKRPRVQVSTLHPYRISDYSLIDESIRYILTPLMAPLSFQLSSSLVHLGKVAGNRH